MSRRRALGLIGVVALIIAVGTVFFRLVEGWSWLDSYFFTVVTLSTVGYGTIVPATALGKIAATVLIFFGLGVFAVAVQQLGHFAIVRRSETRRALRDARARAADAERKADAARRGRREDRER